MPRAPIQDGQRSSCWTLAALLLLLSIVLAAVRAPLLPFLLISGAPRTLATKLHETLRLYPVLPINARTANKDTTIPRGGGKDAQSPVFVPKGSEVAWNTWSMHRRKDYFGDDADEFVPERWEGMRPGWEYLPFNGGPRRCLGGEFRYLL